MAKNTTTANVLANGTKVNAECKDATYIGKVVAFNKGRYTVEFDDGTTLTLPQSKVTERRRGRKALAQLLSPAEMKAERDGLIEALEAAESTDEKKAIRRKLRTRGHTGGLGIRPITVKSINE